MKEKLIKYLMRKEYKKIKETGDQLKLNFYIPNRSHMLSVTDEIFNYFTFHFPDEYLTFYSEKKIWTTFYYFGVDSGTKTITRVVIESMGDRSANLYICSSDPYFSIYHARYSYFNVSVLRALQLGLGDERKIH